MIILQEVQEKSVIVIYVHEIVVVDFFHPRKK
jgi:hypothetical protein